MEVLLRIKNLLETRRVHLLLDNQRAALADRARTTEWRQALADLEKARGGWRQRKQICFRPRLLYSVETSPDDRFQVEGWTLNVER